MQIQVLSREYHKCKWKYGDEIHHACNVTYNSPNVFLKDSEYPDVHTG
jgi:hypothetical protein